MILLTFSNILSFYQKWDAIEKNDYTNPIISEKIYPYTQTISYLRDKEIDFSTIYIAGFDYKGVSLILNDVSFYEYFGYIKNYNLSCDHALKSKNIKTLLVEDRSLSNCNLNVNNEWGLQQEFIKKN